MNRLTYTFFFMLLFWASSYSQGRFEFTPEALTIYDKLTSFRLQEAATRIERFKQEDPDNLTVYHLENYIDFFTLYIKEDKEAYRESKNNKDVRIDKIQSGDQNSPYYLYLEADIRFQWALLKFKFNDYLGGFREISKAHKLLLKNQEKFPDFIANKKNLSILHALVGTVPDSYKWGLKLLSGLEGTIAQGRREIEEVLAYSKDHEFVFEPEAKALYAYLLLHLENEETEAWEFIQNAGFMPHKNPLHCFIMANIAMRAGENDEAIDLLSYRPASRAFLSFEYLDFMLGIAKMRRLDADADLHLLSYVNHFEGDNFIKEAYQKLAWFGLIFEGEAAYFQHMEACQKKGTTDAGRDKDAAREARAGVVPNVDLIKARLLFDGGYFQRALDVLDSLDGEQFLEKRNQLEYYYRKGRIHHGLKQFPLAIWHYQQTIYFGEGDPAFYACNAALQTGLIYEELGNQNQARAFFRRCLDMTPDEYRNSLHLRAKAGLNRLKN